MDANGVDCANPKFEKFHTNNDLVDVFLHLHLNIITPPTYQCGDNRLDYTFITPYLVPALRSTGFLPYNIPFTPDHRAAYADFDEDLLFMGTTNNLLDHAYRNLITSIPKCRENYCESLKQTFKRDKIIEKYKNIDRKSTELMIGTEKRCRSLKKSGYVWSIKLVYAARA
eukprot:12744444-Ditylum_brightwellii.AAC.1